MEDKPTIAQKTPFGVDVKAGKKYFWCTCGKSAKQPFCDGNHRGSSFMPKLVKFEEDKKVYWCGCKHTKNDLGLCDGTHKGL